MPTIISHLKPTNNKEGGIDMNMCIWADYYGWCFPNDHRCPYIESDSQMDCDQFDDGDFHPEIKPKDFEL